MELGTRRARALRHRIRASFCRPPVAELDMAFVVDAYCAKGLSRTSARRKRLRLLRRISASLEPLDDVFRERQHVKIALAPSVRPVCAAFLVVLLRWPDRGLPANLADGFELAGPLARVSGA